MLEGSPLLQTKYNQALLKVLLITMDKGKNLLEENSSLEVGADCLATMSSNMFGGEKVRPLKSSHFQKTMRAAGS